jgi:precorrin-6B C5,15-methyltransferase / cobalt-precorrin-6B C5,C15-methyltransferase
VSSRSPSAPDRSLHASTAEPAVTIVGIGADGWAGLGPTGRAALTDAEVIFGSSRQLEMVPPELVAVRVTWPKPLVEDLAGLLAEHAGRRRAVLASGDPTLYGIASTIARRCPELAQVVVPHPSSVSLACARLGWAQQDVDVISLLARPLPALHLVVHAGRRVLVLAEGAQSPARVAELLRARGFGRSRLIALSNLGAEDEQRVECSADEWPATGWPEGTTAEPLTVLGFERRPGPDADRLSLVPGLPDDAYENDGQLTKRHVRAITLSSLAPSPGERLWDVGGGAGSIGIEWLRLHPSCEALCVERDPERVARIQRNAEALGVPRLHVVTGDAPQVLTGLPTPDAVFIGGGAGRPGMIEACWQALAPGGRLVVNVTTLESEQAVYAARDRHGGELTRIEITRAAPIGRFTGWRPAMPVTQWVVTKHVDTKHVETEDVDTDTVGRASETGARGTRQ